MHTAEKIADRHAGFHRLAALGPRDAHHAAGGLDGKVHRQIVPVRASRAKTGAGGIDQLRICRLQFPCTASEAVEHAGRKVLQQDIRLAG